MVRQALISLLLSLASTVAGAAGFTDTMTGTFDERIRTLRVVANDDIFAPPVLFLNAPGSITVSFDHLADDREYFRYRLVHCNASWQPSGLVDSEIIDGFNEGLIEDFDYSRATTVHYVNYRLTIPNADMAPMVSGNYLLQIYRQDDPDTIVAQCRFMVSEQSAVIGAEITSRTDRDYNEASQQLSLAVDVERSDVRDLFNDVRVMIQQNGRLDSEVALVQPLRVSGRTLIYEHQPGLIFDAGNEYRRFETTSVNYPGMRVADIEWLDPYYHFTIETDTPRNTEQYLYDSTQRGRFVVREYNSTESDTEADYAVVHFTLDYPETPGLMIFLDGDFVNRRFDSSSQMAYNEATGRYERALLLKQGSYNYQYLAVPPKKSRGYTSVIEGDRYQTVNEYLVKVYTRRQGERYDRLIGVASFLSDR